MIHALNGLGKVGCAMIVNEALVENVLQAEHVGSRNVILQVPYLRLIIVHLLHVFLFELFQVVLLMLGLYELVTNVLPNEGEDLRNPALCQHHIVRQLLIKLIYITRIQRARGAVIALNLLLLQSFFVQFQPRRPFDFSLIGIVFWFMTMIRCGSLRLLSNIEVFVNLIAILIELDQLGLRSNPL